MHKFFTRLGILIILAIMLLDGIMLFSAYKNKSHVIPEGALNDNSKLLFIEAKFDLPEDVQKEYKDEVEVDGRTIRLYEILNMKIICVLDGETFIIDPVVTEENVIGAKLILSKPIGDYRSVNSIRFKLSGYRDTMREHVPINNGEVNLGIISFTPPGGK
ncbi:MAG: hypothetical protein M1269_03720 [Chloroflexi bacterium]|nr:hypothetical protein [Chloroflexota bacterium]